MNKLREEFILNLIDRLRSPESEEENRVLTERFVNLMNETNIEEIEDDG